jgi:hypothetical protein
MPFDDTETEPGSPYDNTFSPFTESYCQSRVDHLEPLLREAEDELSQVGAANEGRRESLQRRIQALKQGICSHGGTVY